MPCNDPLIAQIYQCLKNKLMKKKVKVLLLSIYIVHIVVDALLLPDRFYFSQGNFYFLYMFPVVLER